MYDKTYIRRGKIQSRFVDRFVTIHDNSENNMIRDKQFILISFYSLTVTKIINVCMSTQARGKDWGLHCAKD